MTHARIGQIGTRPLGFNTCRYSEKLLQATGITVVPVDMSEIIFNARKIDNDAAELKAKMEEISHYAKVPEAYQEKLALQAKFGLAVEQWIEANEVDATAIQCWDSLEQNYGCAACVTMSMLGEKLITVRSARLTWPVPCRCTPSALPPPGSLQPCWTGTTTSPKTATSASAPTAGNARPRASSRTTSSLALSAFSGRTLGKVNTFGAVYGKCTEGEFTYFRISTDDNLGCIKSYLGKGKLTNDPYGMDGCIAVTQVDNLQKLMKFICKNGFEHHVAMVRTDVVDILREAVDNYLGWDLYVHE